MTYTVLSDTVIH